MLSASSPCGVALERHGAVAVIAFDRPDRRNAMDMSMREEFARLAAQSLADESLRAIVLTGRGGHFCAGGDIGSMGQGPEGMSAEVGRERMRRTLQSVSALYSCDKPVLAAVEGCAYGGGFGLALLADMVIAAQGARFCMSFARVGLVPDSGALYTLPRIVGVQRAKELMFSARELDADQAHDWGIAMEVVPRGGALARALQLAQAMAGASPAATAMTKTALNNSLSSDLHSMVELEANAQGLAFSTAYHREAKERFLNKRPPLFAWPAQPKNEFEGGKTC
ncbi:enoyl-CoA hydratase/isomerase family protein [Comamonas testosteroni]|uniref:Enoyl-CoA hydratase n=1 Tax=Comamonas testosteroni TaxID=285 RepID=A0A096H4C6_COMTE|nr:enoyl-CoA hydratase/isomerase family protein [Comamonas testosteroni]KGH32295.1 enoyl-CoA hydratase [Comamonas testosteroni]